MMEKYPYTRPLRVTEGPFSWDGAELSFGGIEDSLPQR